MDDNGQQGQKGPGRPALGESGAVGHVHLRVTMARKNRWVRTARGREMGLSEWMTTTCDAECERGNKQEKWEL